MGLDWRLDLVIPEVFFNLDGSMIQCEPSRTGLLSPLRSGVSPCRSFHLKVTGARPDCRGAIVWAGSGAPAALGAEGCGSLCAPSALAAGFEAAVGGWAVPSRCGARSCQRPNGEVRVGGLFSSLRSPGCPAPGRGKR